MSSDLETLLAPISEDDPTGPDLDSDPDMVEIRTAFESGFSDDADDASPVNWTAIANSAEAMLARSKDIWIAVYMMRAAAKADRIQTVLLGSQVLNGLIEQYWEKVHPDLEEWGVNARITPIASLGMLREFVNPLKKVTLLSHPRLGKYSGADFVRLERGGDSEDDFGQFKAALNDADREELDAALAAFEAIEDALRQVDRTFMFNADGDGPNLQNAYDAITEIRSSFRFHLGGPELSDSGVEDAGSSDSGYEDSAPSGGGSFGGRIEKREDVVRALDAIADYYRRKEPSSPVPVILKRAREWVSLDFLTILQDIVPNGMDDARRILVFQSDESPSYDD
ncbi:type VI secretion system protein TssA [Novosphingobium sp.]|uniref:type VI secretion system protein TssA n=1 Tax=Novosphingobium sp. TaxID=1874826 RepID=UPI00286E205C|nr:type VI secretion system protein TssA [Novosphingobium sp.]